MWKPLTFNNGETYPYGLAWRLSDIRGHKLIAHSGQTAGFGASVSRFVDDDLSVIALTNLGESGMGTPVQRGSPRDWCDPRSHQFCRRDGNGLAECHIRPRFAGDRDKRWRDHSGRLVRRYGASQWLSSPTHHDWIRGVNRQHCPRCYFARKSRSSCLVLIEVREQPSLERRIKPHN